MNTNRRKFLATVGMTLGAGLLTQNTFSNSESTAAITVGDLMDAFIREVPGAPFSSTVDTLKAGSRDMAITGVVTTMFPTLSIIRKAIGLKANFLIVHEPSYYNHLDDTAWLSGSDVYNFKAKLLQESNLAIWRNHDYVHSLAQDGVMAGVVEQLNWKRYYQQGRSLTIPATTLGDLIKHVKVKMDVPALRYAGNLTQTCEKVLLMPGAAGGKRQIEMLMREKPDVIICGEVSEWETPEYVRDANAKGDRLGLIVIGHAASEEAGSEFMAQWVKRNFPSIPVSHVPATNSLGVI
jgi:putative NIF3 family GTP cyclohydrolase 1 type 2